MNPRVLIHLIFATYIPSRHTRTTVKRLWPAVGAHATNICTKVKGLGFTVTGFGAYAAEFGE